MKTKKANIFSKIILMTLIMTNFSCGVEEIIDELDGGCDEAWTVQVKPELDALNAAASVFQSSPTMANCETFRAAAINYVDAMEEVEVCVLGENRQAFEQALDAAKADLSQYDCSDL